MEGEGERARVSYDSFKNRLQGKFAWRRQGAVAFWLLVCGVVCKHVCTHVHETDFLKKKFRAILVGSLYICCMYGTASAFLQSEAGMQAPPNARSAHDIRITQPEPPKQSQQSINNQQTNKTE